MFPPKISVGGAIYNGGSTLIVDGSTIGRSGGGNSAPQGGGIYSVDGSLTIRNGSGFHYNSANTYGGSVLSVCRKSCSGTILTVSRTGNVFSNNTANYGGGIALRSAVATIAGSSFSNNTATGMGNDILIMESQVTIASDVSVSGGGIFRG